MTFVTVQATDYAGILWTAVTTEQKRMLLLTRSAAGLPPRRTTLDPKPVFVEFLKEKMALR
jgi:hypothetical protein